jgi:hypothetical protein
MPAPIMVTWSGIGGGGSERHEWRFCWESGGGGGGGGGGISYRRTLDIGKGGTLEQMRENGDGTEKKRVQYANKEPPPFSPIGPPKPSPRRSCQDGITAARLPGTPEIRHVREDLAVDQRCDFATISHLGHDTTCFRMVLREVCIDVEVRAWEISGGLREGQGSMLLLYVRLSRTEVHAFHVAVSLYEQLNLVWCSEERFDKVSLDLPRMS